MATIQDAIKRLTYMFTSTGADKVAADLGKVGDAQAKVAASAETTSRASLSLEKSFDNLERRYVSTVRAQQDFEKVQNTVNAAVAQNPALQDRANVVLDAAREKFDAAKGSATGFNAILEAGRGAALGYAAGIGPIGALLGSFGPWGIAAAAGIGLVSAAFEAASESAKKFGEQSLQIRSFADATGITTTEVRGLAEAGAKAGLGADTMKTAFERLTANLAETRTKTGVLFDSIQAINPALANEIANTRSGAEAWDLLAKAISSTADATLKAQIAKAAFGRGGVELIPALSQTNAAGGIKEYSDEVQRATGITDQLTRSTASQLAVIESLKRDTADIWASIYSDDVLRRMRIAAEFQNQIAKSAKEAAGMPGGVTAQWQNPFIQETNRSAGIGPAAPIPQGAGGSGITADTSAITAQMAAINAQAAAVANLAKANQDSASAWQGVANDSAKMITLLGGAATGEEIYEARVQALTAAFYQNKFGAIDSADAIEKYNRALHGDTDKQVAALEDQLKIVQATTEQQKLSAQRRKDYNDAVRSGKSDEDASAIATAKSAISIAEAAKSSLEWQQNMLGVSKATQQAADAAQQAAIAFENAARAAQGVDLGRGGDFGDFSVPKGAGSTSVVPLGTSVVNRQGGTGMRLDDGSRAALYASWRAPQTPDAALASGGIDAAIRAARYARPADLSSIGSLYDLKNAQTTDKGVQISNLQQEIALLNTLPETIARDQQIVSLMNSINQLKHATDANTAATAATLNPLYSQGHGALSIGYFKAARGLDMIAQGPSSGDQIPFRAMVNGGERIRIGDASNDNSGSRTVVNNNSFVFNNTSTSNARRNQRQFAQSLGTTAHAMSR